MTGLAGAPAAVPAAAPAGAVEAGRAAADAATAAGVEIRPLHDMADLEEVDRLFVSIWNPGKDQTPISSHTLRALSHAGNYVAGAYDGVGLGESRLAGACVGFFGAPRDRVLHSHIAGVSLDARGRSVGYALKLHQYAWSLGQGVGEVNWTFDPLVRRNAYFNIAKLGAVPTAYLPDFYGDMTDGLNAGQGSDRLFVSWAIAPTLDVTRRELEPPGARLLLDESPDGRPVASPGPDGPSGAPSLVRVPADIESLRGREPAVGRSWRSALRDVLGAQVAAGARVTGFTRSGCYVLDGSGS